MARWPEHVQSELAGSGQCCRLLPAGLKPVDEFRGHQEARTAQSASLMAAQAFLAHRTHQPSGLILPSTTLQVLDSAMKFTQLPHFCSPFG